MIFRTIALLVLVSSCSGANMSGSGKKNAAEAKPAAPAAAPSPAAGKDPSGKDAKDEGKSDKDGKDGKDSLGNEADEGEKADAKGKDAKDGEIDLEDQALKPITANLAVTRQADTAAWTNCLFVQVNGGPEVNLGCNKGALAPTVAVQARPKPFCNQVRLNLHSNGQKNRSTEFKDHITQDFRIQKTGASQFHIQCNDNRDDDFNDLNVIVASADGKASFTIENSGLPCD